MILPFWFYLLLLLTALVYSMVGHGGASGYIALMVLFGLDQNFIRPAALVLNIVAASIAFFAFRQRGHFHPRMFMAFAMGSVPAAFLGGGMEFPGFYFRYLLGCILLIPVLRQLGIFRNIKLSGKWSFNFPSGMSIGAAVGLVSGMIGVGGGILLSPLLLFLRWTDQKETAALSAPFIVINSVAGLAGLTLKGSSFSASIGYMIPVVIAGAVAGSLTGARRIPNTGLAKVLALVLSIAALKLFLQ